MKKKWISVILLLSIIGVVTIGIMWLEKVGEIKEIHTLDVPGSGMVLVKNNKEHILIGGGEEVYADRVYEYLKKQEVEKIDTVIWTNPTKEVTGTYKELIYEIPIENLYINQVENMDEFSEEITKMLAGVNCQIRTDFKMINLKMEGGGSVKSIVIEDEQERGKSATLIEIQFKELSYVWIAHDKGLKKVGEGKRKELERILPDILNLGMTRKESWMEEIDSSQLKAVITSEREEGEVERILVMDKSEGEIIIYKGQRGYEIINKKSIEAKVL